MLIFIDIRPTCLFFCQ